MRAVLGNLYGTVAGYHQEQKNMSFRVEDETIKRRMKQAPRGHTAASLRAAEYVKRTNFDATRTKMGPFDKDTEEIFKMRKFKGVTAKVNSNNVGRMSSAKVR